MRLLVLYVLIFISCSATKKTTQIQKSLTVPVITFDNQTIDLGVIKRGEKRSAQYAFTNTGGVDLLIELVTACKCTAIDWTRSPIPPGGKGELEIIFDSKDQDLGVLEKTIDIIANTEPIVVECFMKAEIVN